MTALWVLAPVLLPALAAGACLLLRHRPVMPRVALVGAGLGAGAAVVADEHRRGERGAFECDPQQPEVVRDGRELHAGREPEHRGLPAPPAPAAVTGLERGQHGEVRA
ncbi:MAG: hypothetical protein ACKOC6_00625, partial [bacterium]